MARRYFNWKLAAVLVIGLAIVTITAYGLRQWRRSSRSENAIKIGNQAYAKKQWEQAATHFGRYIVVNPSDVSVLLKYADAQLNIRPLKTNNIQHAIGSYRNILRMEKDNLEAALKLTELYLGMRMPGEAELIAQRILEVKPDAEMQRMLALAFIGQRKFSQAVSELNNIIENEPNFISAYETLWQLTKQRPEVSTEVPDYWLDKAVENNPSSAMAYIIRANSHIIDKDMKKALTDLDIAEKQDMSDSKIRLRLATGFINAEALDRAEEHLKILQGIESDNLELWQAWAQLAQQSGSEEKMLQVAEAGLQELSAYPWDFMITAVELFLRGGKPDHADECLSQLRQRDIALASVAFYEGLVAEQKGSVLKAIKCWQRAIELGNKSPRVRLALALGFSRLGDNQSALRELKTLTLENPDFFEGYLTLARLSAKIGDWEQTADVADKAIQLVPTNLGAALLRLQAQVELLSTGAESELVENIKRQLSAMEKATSDAVSVKLVRFRLAIKQGELDYAETLINELRQDKPDNPKITIAQLELLIAMNKTKEAISTFNTLIEQYPQMTESVVTFASLMAQRNDYEKCESIIKDALVRIKEPQAQQRLSLLLVQYYMEWKQQDKAYNFLNTFVKKFPDDISVRRRLITFEIMKKNLEKAQEYVDKIKALEGEDGWQWRYEQARVWYDSDDFENLYTQIVSLLKENLLLDLDDQASRILLAAAYEKSGDIQLSLSMYRQALERSPRDVRIIVPVISALYRAGEYNEADEILNRTVVEKLYHPDLQAIQLRSYLREGQLDSASRIMSELLASDPNDKAVMLSFALLKIRQEKFDQADELLNKLIAMEPDVLPVIVAQIQSKILQNKDEEAVKICDETVAKLNNAEAYILRARTLASLKQTDKAIKDINYIVSAEPNNVNVWVSSSDFYRSIGQHDKAAADIKHAISLAPDNLAIQKRAIMLFLASRNSDMIQQGKTILENALKLAPDDIDLLMHRARLNIADGTAPALAGAADILEKVTQRQPQIDEAWVMLGNLLLRQGQSSRAMDTALRGLVNNPNNKLLLLLKANVEASQSPVLAIPTLKSLREIEPNDFEVTLNLANAYINADEYAKAVNLLKEQLNNNADDESRQRCNIALAVAMFKNGQKDEADKILTSLAQSSPDDSRILLAQINLLMEDGRYGDITNSVTDWFRQYPQNTRILIAIADRLMTAKDQSQKAYETAESILRMVMAKDPNDAAAAQMLAIIMQISARSTEAIELNQKLLELNPSNVVAMNNLAWMLCEEKGQYQQAIDIANEGLEIAPQYVDLIDTRGMVYYRLGQYDKAIEDFTVCIKLYPTDAPGRVNSFLHLAKAFIGAEKKDKAIEYLNKTLNIQNQFGGLTPEDLDEARSLLEALSKE
ncbi:MAG: tetratricopeptide repeat protein [Sedimentisphaerales bacterium]|nr:tetratricopeptide repeat protein [Sedimentisphaerales bacterium]